MRLSLIAGGLALLLAGCGKENTEPDLTKGAVAFTLDATCVGPALVALQADNTSLGAPTLTPKVRSSAFPLDTGSHDVRAVTDLHEWTATVPVVGGATAPVSLPCTGIKYTLIVGKYTLKTVQTHTLPAVWSTSGGTTFSVTAATLTIRQDSAVLVAKFRDSTSSGVRTHDSTFTGPYTQISVQIGVKWTVGTNMTAILSDDGLAGTWSGLALGFDR